jgi:hypothetical protein
MGANATKNENIIDTSSLSKFNIDLAKQTKIIINTVNKVSQEITSKNTFNSNTNATITISNSNIDGSLNITNTTLSANSIVDISIFNTSNFTNELDKSLTQQFEDTLKDQFNSVLTPETINKVISESGLKVDSSLGVSVNSNISKNEKYSEVISSFIDKSKNNFKNTASNKLSQSLKTQITESFNTSASILINNVNISNNLNIDMVNLAAVSKVTSNIVIKSGLVSTFIEDVKNSLSNVANISSSNEDSSKVSTESDLLSSTTTNADGIIKGLQTFFAMPVNLLSVLVFGIVAVIAILGVVIVLIIKYLTTSPESLNIIANTLKNKQTLKTEPTLNDEYLNKIDNLLTKNVTLERSL